MSLRGLCCNAVLVANNVECGRAFSPIQWLWGDYFLYTAFRSNVMWSCRPGITNVTPDSHKGDVVTGHYCCDTREEGHSPLTPAHDTGHRLVWRWTRSEPEDDIWERSGVITTDYSALREKWNREAGRVIECGWSWELRALQFISLPVLWNILQIQVSTSPLQVS